MINISNHQHKGPTVELHILALTQPSRLRALVGTFCLSALCVGVYLLCIQALSTSLVLGSILH